MTKIRGFEIVSDEHRKAKEVFKNNKGKTKEEFIDITIPTRSDERSAGYDLYIPTEVKMLPGENKVIFTDVKAYMQDDEVLKTYIRSSLAVKRGLALTNSVGIIDASYYNNEFNDGNIGIPIVNNSTKSVTIKAGERIAQGIFEKYLVTDSDDVENELRSGGFGSSGE